MIRLFNCRNDIKVLNEVKKVLLTNEIFVGENVKKLEKKLCQFFSKKKYIVATSDLANSIFLVLKAKGIKKNDEILIPSFNCLSSTNPIKNIGAKPIWVDLEKNYPEMSLEMCQKLITKKTKALILYHIAGYPADTFKFKKFCKKNKILFIEDINSSLGAKQKNIKIGTHSDIAILSFYPNRHLSSINGAAIACKNKSFANKLKSMRKFGIVEKRNKKSFDNKFLIKREGHFFEMPDINAAILNSKIQEFNKKMYLTNKNVNFFDKNLISNNLFKKILPDKHKFLNNWIYFIRSNKSKFLMKKLNEKKIETSKIHFPNHKYTNLFKTKKKLQNTEKFYKEVVGLPCGWWLKKKEITYIVKTLNNLR